MTEYEPVFDGRLGEIEEHHFNEMEWPEYYVSGEDVDNENFAPAYYKVKGPNGPVLYMNPSSDEPRPTTMYDFAMEARADSFRWCEREETPWEEYEQNET